MYPPRAKFQASFKDEKRSKEKEKEKDKDKDKEKDKEKEKDKDKEREKDIDKDHILDSMIDEQEGKAVLNGLPMCWLNAIIGRICFDLLRSPLWQGRILQRLQKKLSTLKVTSYFLFLLCNMYLSYRLCSSVMDVYDNLLRKLIVYGCNNIHWVEWQCTKKNLIMNYALLFLFICSGHIYFLSH